MNLYDKASLIITPNAYKAGKIYAAKPTSGAGDLTFARNSVAYRNNALGVLEQVAINTPRLNYNTIGGCPALLIEPARTNLCLQSETINGWTASSATFTKTNTTVLGLNASKFVCNTTSNGVDYQAGLRYVSMPCTLLASTTYTMSFFVEKTSINSVFSMFFLANPSGFDGQYIATFNATSSTTTMSGYGAAYTNKSAKITQVSGNVYFCETTFTTPANNSSVITIVFGFGPGGANTQIAGNEGSFAGLQIEQGAFATSRILTTTAAVTRVADNISLDITTLCSKTSGTLLINFLNNQVFTPDSAQAQQLGIGSGFAAGSTADNFWFGQSTNNRIVIWKQINGTLTPIFTTTSNTSKIAIKWNGTTADVFENGVKVVSGTSFIPTNNFTKFSYVNCIVTHNISNMAIYSTPLTDLECITLTT